MGLRALAARLSSDEVKPFTGSLFPRDSMANMRFAINYFTAIGLGGLTNELRADFATAQVCLRLLLVLVCTDCRCASRSHISPRLGSAA
jgi:hypothetical protein